MSSDTHHVGRIDHVWSLDGGCWIYLNRPITNLEEAERPVAFIVLL